MGCGCVCKWVARTPRSALVHGGVGRTHTFSISEMSSVTAFEKGLRIIITSLPRGRAPPRATSGCARVKGQRREKVRRGRRRERMRVRRGYQDKSVAGRKKQKQSRQQDPPHPRDKELSTRMNSRTLPRLKFGEAFSHRFCSQTVQNGS